jgi:tetratricopeptide (TPR) repeat protein
MKRLLITLALTLVALPAWTQTPDENKAQCFSTEADAKIRGCTALIDAKQTTGAELAVVYNNRGVAYDVEHLHEQAIADFTHAIALRPDYAYAYFHRGIAYDAWSLPGRASRDFSKAIEIKKDYADAWYHLGSVHWETAHYDWAITDFTNAITLKPDYAEAYYARGSAYHAKGLRDQAVADYRAALKIDPKMEVAQTGLNVEGALPPGGAQSVAAGLPGAAWTRYTADCEIHQVDFDASTARIKRAWDSGYTHWALVGDQLQFTFDVWDAKLIGTIVSANEIDFSFEWKTTDNLQHYDKCKFNKKQ